MDGRDATDQVSWQEVGREAADEAGEAGEREREGCWRENGMFSDCRNELAYDYHGDIIN